MRVRLKWPFVLSGLLMTMACGGEDPNDEDPYERPEEARAIISDAQLRQFEEAGMQINGGNTPPSIAGTYFFGDPTIEYNTSERWPANSNWCHHNVTYSTTDNANLYATSFVSTNCDGSGEGSAAYISGQGNCFTLYTQSSGTFEGCYQEGIGVFSACVAANGDFINVKEGSLATLTDESAACATVINRGSVTANGELTVTSYAIAPQVE